MNVYPKLIAESTYRLAKFIGTPFANDSDTDLDVSDSEKSGMHLLARNNKLGLMFLDRLRKIDELSHLRSDYESDIERYKETAKTAVNLCSSLDRMTNEYAVFKFVKPFTHTPSDVDILFFTDSEEFRRIVSCLTNDGYRKIAESPSQTVVYDLRGGVDRMDPRSVGGKAGGRYYIDLYSDVSASHIVYIDRETVKPYRTKHDLECGPIWTLNAAADLSVVLAHSIIPERLLTMADYLTTLHTLKSMQDSQIRAFVEVLESNSMLKAGWHSMNVVSLLHEGVHGFVPETIVKTIDMINNCLRTSPKPNAVEVISMPFRYSVRTLLDVLCDRAHNNTGFKSIVRQSAHSTNPRLASWVLSNWMVRGKRDTY